MTPTPIAASFAPVLAHVNVTATESLLFAHPTDVLFVGENDVKTGPVVGGVVGLGELLGEALGLSLGLSLGATLGLALGDALGLAPGEAEAGGVAGLESDPLRAPEKSRVRRITTAMSSRLPTTDKTMTSVRDVAGASEGNGADAAAGGCGSSGSVGG